MHARICFHTRQTVSEQLKSLEENVVSLDMSALRLGEYPIEELEDLMSLIPSGILYLNLGANRLHKLKDKNLQQFFMSIAKTNVHYVSLHHNALGSVSTEKLLPAFECLFGFLNALDLGHNEFWRKSSESWRYLFSTKRIQHLEYINLSGNFIITQGEELTQKMSSLLSMPVHGLSLALNQLGEKKSNDLKGLFFAVSPTIKTLDLQKNALHRLSIDAMRDLEGSLSSVINLYVSSGEINRMTYEQLDVFAALLPACQQVVAITRINQIASSDKINYIQKKLGMGDKLITEIRLAPLLEMNKHDNTIFLSSAIEKLKRMSQGTDCTGFFNRLTACI